MSGTFPFTKMHGLGNDFIVVDLRAIPFADWFDVHLGKPKSGS